MAVVWLLDPKTRISYAIDGVYEGSVDAATRAAKLRVKHPDNLFHHTLAIPPEKFYSLEEALQIVNGKVD